MVLPGGRPWWPVPDATAGACPGYGGFATGGLSYAGRTIAPGDNARRVHAMIFCVSLTAVLLAAAPAASPAASRFRGALYASAFEEGADPMTALRTVVLPPADRERLDRYLGRWRAFRGGPAKGVDAGLASRRRVVERGIAALLESPDAGERAAAFARKAIATAGAMPRSDGPWNEAALAEGLLRDDAEAPLAPYLYVFVSDRYRAAYELAGQEANPQRQKAAARKYRTFVVRAHAAADPLLGWLTEDLDAKKFLVYDTGVHPKDFNPDG